MTHIPTQLELMTKEHAKSLNEERLRKNQEAWQYAKAHEPQLKQLMLVFGSMIWSAELKVYEEKK